MKAVVEYGKYQEYLKKILYGLHAGVILLAIIGVGIYKYVGLLSENMADTFFTPEVLADYFFKVILVWAIFYFVKKLWITKAVDRFYDVEGVDENYWFLPCLYNTRIYNSWFGNILIDEDTLWFNANRVSKEPVKFKANCSDLKISVHQEPYNVFAKFLWGETAVLELEDLRNKKKARFLVPNPEAVSQELLRVVNRKE
jgi:hypothetical protein